MSNKLRVLFAREHETVYGKLGAFLAGPTPPEESMNVSWRRRLISLLKEDDRLDASMLVVAPEPEQCSWKSIIKYSGDKDYDKVVNKQIPWELQYLSLCDITVFWFATYWSDEKGGVFPGNIGPTARLEFGYYLQEYLKRSNDRTFIVGAPDDAESIEWVKEIVSRHNLDWHGLAVKDKDKLVPDSLVEALINAFIKNKRVL